MSSLFKSLGDWFDDRAGVRKLVHDALYENIPGGSRWRYVWGSALATAFLTQVVTGVFLWMAYSPSTQTAWESVYYIQYEMTGGWLLRGIHHFMASAMVILLALHFVQVVWDGAYRAPRELNFVIGLILMLIVLALALTGYLLPWDQKGYWATKVGTELSSQTPLVGAEVKKLTVGGPEYGHHTLTRFFALHAGVLPGALIAFLVAHIALFRRHGLHAKDPQRGPDEFFWPDQVLKDSVAALGVLAAVLGLTIYYHGAELTAPADPANPYNAARPEWYFLFLFQFLKWFPGELEVWGAIVIPSLTFLLLLAMPWIGRTRVGHFLNVSILCVLIGGAVALTVQAWYDDHYAQFVTEEEVQAANDESMTKRFDASTVFLEAKRTAHREAERAIQLAGGPNKIPPAGALELLYNDPYLQGPRLFKQNCAGCHNYENLEDPDAPDNIVNDKPSAPNLYDVGSRRWIEGLLNPELIATSHYFGYEGSPFVGDGDYTDMVGFIQDAFSEDRSEELREQTAAAFKKIALTLSAEAQLTAPEDYSDQDRQAIEEGIALMTGGLSEQLELDYSCTDCHTFRDYEGGSPVLEQYMSRQWMIDLIKDPTAEAFYGEMNDRMPLFAPHADPRLNQLDQQSVELIVDWLRGQWAQKGDEQ